MASPKASLALPSLMGLSLRERPAAIPVAPIGAAHGGLNLDAGDSVGMIALSRVVKTKGAMLALIARSPLAVALLAEMQTTVLRVLRNAGGFDAGLSESSIAALFRLPGSATRYAGQYGGGLGGGLQQRLPQARFKAVVGALLDALTASRAGPKGGLVGTMLLASTPTTAVTEAGQAAIRALSMEVEAAMLLTLVSGSSSSSSRASRGGSSSNSARSTPPPTPPPPPSGPVLVVPAVIVPPPAAFTLDPSQALITNVIALVSSRLRRALSAGEVAALTDGLDVALSVLQAGAPEMRRDLLQSSVISGLTRQAGAWLWAATVEALEFEHTSVQALADAIADGCGAVAGALFVSVSAVLG